MSRPIRELLPGANLVMAVVNRFVATSSRETPAKGLGKESPEVRSSVGILDGGIRISGTTMDKQILFSACEKSA